MIETDSPPVPIPEIAAAINAALEAQLAFFVPAPIDPAPCQKVVALLEKYGPVEIEQLVYQGTWRFWAGRPGFWVERVSQAPHGGD